MSAATRFHERRASQRGAAVFVVMMVIALLAAVGTFAARSAGIVTQASGHVRQAAQTQYFAELGAGLAIGEFGTGAGAAYVQQMQRAPEDCYLTRNVPLINGQRPPCLKVYSGELGSRFEILPNPNLTGKGSLSPYAFGPSAETDGVMDGNFRVEITDPGQAGTPIAGSDVGGTGGTVFRYLQVNVTTIAQVRPHLGDGVAPDCSNASAPGTQAAVASGVQSVRAGVVFGPLPQ